MAARIGSLYVDLTLNSAGYVSGFGKASAATSRATASINRNVGLSQRTVDRFATSAGNRNFRPYAIIAASRAYETASDRTNLLRGSLLSLTAVAGGFSAAFGTNILARYADTAVNLNNQIRTVTTSSSNLAAIQDELIGVSQRSRTSLQATTTLYARTARATEKLGVSQKNLLKITETVQKSFAIGGATSAEAQGAAIQLAQGIASDRFSGEEFRSVAENAPVLLRGMAEALGVNIGKLREMAHAGELTADVVTKAILKSAGRIEREFGQTVISIDRSLTYVDNKILEFIDRQNQAYGVTGLLSTGIMAFGDSLESIVPPLTAVVGLLGAVAVARNRAAMGGGIGALLGGGAGYAFGGLEGAVLGSAIGGLAGVGATKRDDDGLGIVGRIKADAKAAKDNVVELAREQSRLRQQVLSSGLEANRARRDAEGNLFSLAPKSDQSAYLREQVAIQKLDEKKINLLDAQRRKYADLSAISAKMSPRAAKLADTQLKSEAALNDSLENRSRLVREIKAAETRETSRLGMTVTTGTQGKLTAEAIKTRISLQKELARNEQRINRQTTDVEQRRIRLSELASEADRKAAQSRIETGRQIYTNTAALNEIDQKRLEQTRMLAAARSKAEQSGGGIARENVERAQASYRGLADRLKDTTTQLGAATRAATPMAQAMNFVHRQGSSLVSLFGGPWGVALTAAAIAFADFASQAQRRAQSIANAKRLIDEVLEQSPNALPGGQAGGIVSNQIEKLEENIERVRTGASNARRELQSIFDPAQVRMEGIGSVVEAFVLMGNAARDLPLSDLKSRLSNTLDEFVGGNISVSEFRNRISELNKEAGSTRFNELSAEVLRLGNTIAAEGIAVDAFRQKIEDLQAAANDPVNITIRTTFEALNEQPVDATLTNATSQMASGIGFTREVEKELETARLIGDARKKAEYTDSYISKAEKAGVAVTAAIRKQIDAFVAEKIALENRDSALKKSEKENPYEKAIASIQEKTEAQRLEIATIGQSTYMIERAKAAQDLETAAKEAKLALTPQLTAEINRESSAYAAQAMALENLEKRRKEDEERINFYRGVNNSFFVDLKNNIAEGGDLWAVFGNAAASALSKISDRLAGLAGDGFFDMLLGGLGGVLGGGFGGMGGFSPSIGHVSGFGSYGIFADGGFTGFGQKYEPAGVVHRGEYVFDADAVRRIGIGNLNMLRQGYANGGFVGPAPSLSMPPVPNSTGVKGGFETTINVEASSDPVMLGAQIARSLSDFTKNELPRHVRQIMNDPHGIG